MAFASIHNYSFWYIQFIQLWRLWVNACPHAHRLSPPWCFDNKMVKLPGGSSCRSSSKQLTIKKLWPFMNGCLTAVFLFQTPSWKIMDNKGRITVVLHWERDGPLPLAGPSRQSSTCSTIAAGGPRLLGVHSRSISQVRIPSFFGEHSQMT